MPLGGYIPRGRFVSCDCLGTECEEVLYEDINFQGTTLAITGRADQVAGSTTNGGLVLAKSRDRVTWSIQDDAPETQALGELRELVGSGVEVYGRPLIAQPDSQFTESGQRRTYQNAVVRALLVKPILDDDRKQGWEPVAELDEGGSPMELRYAKFEERDGRLRGTLIRYGDTAYRGSFTETFAPGSVRFPKDDDVVLNFMHKGGQLVARTGGGGLTLHKRDDRIDIEVDVPDDTIWGKETRALVKKNVLRGFSMEFAARKQHFEGRHRIITEALVPNIGVVDRPAYADSVIEKRLEDLYQMDKSFRDSRIWCPKRALY